MVELNLYSQQTSSSHIKNEIHIRANPVSDWHCDDRTTYLKRTSKHERLCINGITDHFASVSVNIANQEWRQKIIGVIVCMMGIVELRVDRESADPTVNESIREVQEIWGLIRFIKLLSTIVNIRTRRIGDSHYPNEKFLAESNPTKKTSWQPPSGLTKSTTMVKHDR